MTKSNYRKECPNSFKIGVLKGICILLALITIMCAIGWGVCARRETCIGMTEAEITHCEIVDGRCYFFVLTDDFISDGVNVPKNKYGMYVEGDVILVDVMANHEGEKKLYFSEENA